MNDVLNPNLHPPSATHKVKEQISIVFAHYGWCPRDSNIVSQFLLFLSPFHGLGLAVIGKSLRPSPDQLAGKHVYVHHAV